MSKKFMEVIPDLQVGDDLREILNLVEVEKVVLPQVVSIKKASELMGLPAYYLRRLCKEVPGLAFQSGVKWYINLGKLAEYYNNIQDKSS